MHKIVTFTFDDKLSDRISRAMEGSVTCVRVDPTSATAQGLVHSFDPDVVVVDAGRGLSTGSGSINDLMRILRQTFSSKPIVAVGDEFSAQGVLAAMRAGANDFIERDSDLNEIRGQLATHLAQPLHRRDGGQPQAPLTVVMSGLADEHEPQLALNLAVSFAGEQKSGDVVLVDLTLPASEAAIGLGIKASYTIREVLLDLPRLDRMLLTSAMSRHEESGLYLLPMAVAGEDVRDVRAADIVAVIFLLRGMFREVVVSLGHLRQSVALAQLLPSASNVLVVTSQHIDSVKACADLFHQRGVSTLVTDRFHLAVAEYDRDIDIDEQQIREVLGLDSGFVLPAARTDLINCFNGGRPIVTEKPNIPYSRTVRAIAAACRGERPDGGRSPGWSIGRRVMSRLHSLF